MSDTVEKIETAPQAIDRAFEFFNRFMDKSSYQYPLLEGVKHLGPNWQIVIGYDLGSSRETVGLFTGEKVTPRRMTRTFIISEDDGTLIEMK